MYTHSRNTSLLMGTLFFVGKHISVCTARVAIKSIVECCCVCADMSVT